MSNRSLFILILFLNSYSFCQVGKTYKDEYLDSLIAPIGQCKNKSLREISDLLKLRQKNDLLQYSVIAKWVVNNFNYSLNAKGKNINYALKSRNAVCMQYAIIIDSLSTNCGLETEYITGFAKSSKTIGRDGLEYHAWNSVKIDGIIYLSDITWSDFEVDRSNNQQGNLGRTYFLMEPSKFILTHYPDERKQKYTKYSWSNFKKSPIYYWGIAEYFHLYFQAENNIKLHYSRQVIKIELFDNEGDMSEYNILGMYIEIIPKNNSNEKSNVIYEFTKINLVDKDRLKFTFNLKNEMRKGGVGLIFIEHFDADKNEKIGRPIFKVFID